MAMSLLTPSDLEKISKQGLDLLYPPKTKITVGMATCCRASGADEVLEAIRQEVKACSSDAVVTTTGCFGICQKEPLVDIVRPGWPRLVYGQMDGKRSRDVIQALAENKIIPKYILCKIEKETNLIENTVRLYPLNGLPEGIDLVLRYEEVPFFGKQQKLVLQNCGTINPDSIEEYIAVGGYRGLYKALKGLEPENIIEEVVQSGLRGRGGAGFSTGTKWRFCRQAKGEEKYVICNADEGDPGAYMDRSILEGTPHAVLEGMMIGAVAIGAQHGVIYVRAEYPLAIEKLSLAIKQSRERGLLGANIFGSGFDFDIVIERGSGAFVCGEETALIASIEGTTGEPRQRPPFPAQQGLWGNPTNINNVKTWATIPLIISRGAAWFSGIGTKKSKGTIIFSMVGNVQNNGLIEVPMGKTLRELIFDIGGGIPGKRKIKAVQTGGPSGGCIPESLLDLPVDYDKLASVGSIMGSGGMVVMDETACMVNVAKYFLSFTKDESCGKCTPCREGTRRMLEILVDITEGRGRPGDIDLLEDMSRIIIDSSLCGLGGTAPNPVLTTIRYFRDEYEEHINNKRCPAGVCKGLFEFYVASDVCTGCGLCLKNCPSEAVTGEKKEPHRIDPRKCVQCGICREVCRFNAIKVR